MSTESIKLGEKTMDEKNSDLEAASSQEHDIRQRFTYAEGQRILRRIDWHIMPLLVLAYLLKNIDSSAISYVKTMNTGTKYNIGTQLHMTTNYYAWTSTAFTISLAVFEIPSNLLLKWATPRLHFVRIILSWSLVCGLTAAAKNGPGLIVVRFFLGMLEAGLYPGISVYCTYWYRPDELAVRFACISVLYQCCNIVLALFAFGVSYMSGVGGLGGWQWLYIFEGILGAFLSAAIYFWQPDFPDTAKFLTEEEKEWVVARLPANAARATDADFSWPEIKLALKELHTWTFPLLLLSANSAEYGYQFWLPTIITSFGFTTTAAKQLLNIPPAFLYLIAGLGGSYIVNTSYRVPRPVFYISLRLCFVACFFVLAYVPNNAALYAMICVLNVIIAWGFMIILPWRCQTLKGSTHASFSIAFHNCIGQLAGTYTAQIFRSQYAPRYTTPFLISIGIAFWTMLVCGWCWYLTFDSERDTRRIAELRHRQGKKDNVVINEDVKVSDDVANRRYD